MNRKLLLSGCIICACMQQAEAQNYTVSGRILDKELQEPLSYTPVLFIKTTNPDTIIEEFSDENGFFSISVPADTYRVKIQLIGYETEEIPIEITDNDIYLSEILLEPSTEILSDLVIDAEKSDVEFKLDKKIYNVADNALAKGGTATEVLENIPSLQVDNDGNVSLRGNASVRVFIDGKSSGISSDVASALKMIAAESIEQVEVITNPSSRYSAEGTGGIINIKLKKGKNNGTNGNTSVSVTNFGGYSIDGAVNHKTSEANIYTQIGYRKGHSEGTYRNETEYRNQTTNNAEKYINEYSDRVRKREGYSARFGVDWNLTPKFSWNQEINIRSTKTLNPVDLFYDTYNSQKQFIEQKQRLTEENGSKINAGYQTTWLYKIDENKGHELVINASINQDFKNDFSTITTSESQQFKDIDQTQGHEDELTQQIKADYVLPLGDTQRFEAGYQGDFNTMSSGFDVKNKQGQDFVSNPTFRSQLVYKEQINALYAQYANQLDKFNFMLGIRWEDSKIDINQQARNEKTTKHYQKFFPSVFANYEMNAITSFSLSYSKKLWRPRGRMINPISSYSSSINFFSGNPDLNPSYANTYELGMLNRWKYITLQTQIFHVHTTDDIAFVRRTYGVNYEGIPITVIGPVNVSNQYKTGVDMNFSYVPYRWWKLNLSATFTSVINRGDYTYHDEKGKAITQNFDSDALFYFFRFNNSIKLPYDVQGQLTLFYKGPEKNAQGTIEPSYEVSGALSKDILDDRATLSIGVRDLFNTKRMIRENHLSALSSRVDILWRKRTFTFSFSYRFNQTKRESQKKFNQNTTEDNEMIM